LIVHVHCLQKNHKEAGRVVKEELARCQRWSDKRGYAKLLLSAAEVNCDRRGNKKREEALEAARQALGLFRDQRDRRQEGAAMLVILALHYRRRLDNDEKGRAMLELGKETQVLFQGLEDRKGEAQALHWIAVAYTFMDAFQDAICAAKKAKSLFREAGNRMLEAHEAHFIAVWYLGEQDPQQALPAAHEALQLFKEIGCRGRREMAALQTLVRAHAAIGDAQQALVFAEDGLLRAQLARDRRMEVEALLLVSQSHLGFEAEAGASAQALEAAERALALARELQDEDAEARIMSLLSALYAQRQEFEQASEIARQALQHVDVKDVEARGAALHAMASAHLARGEYEQALQAANESLLLFRRSGHLRGEAGSLMLMSHVHFEQGAVDAAVAEAKEAQAIYTQEDDKKGCADAMMQVAEFRNANQEHQRALHAADRARMFVQRIGDTVSEARMCLLAAQSRAFLLVKKQDAHEAEARKGHSFSPSWEEVAKASKAAKDAVKLSEQVGDSRGVGNALCVVAQMYIFTQRFELAIAAADEAIVHFVDVGDARNEAAAVLLEAQVYMALGKLKRSLDLARQGHLLFQQVADARGEALALAILSGLREHEFVVDERAAMAPAEAAALMASSAREREPEAVSALAEQPAGLDAGQVRETIQDVTKRMVGATEDIVVDNPLMDIGITSMNAVLFRNKLGNEFEGVDLPVTLVFDYPTIRDLTSMIISRAEE